MPFPKPTSAELAKIKKLMPNPEAIDDSSIGVVRHRLADNEITSYNSVLSEPLMQRFKQDLEVGRGRRGTPLRLDHNKGTSLVLGRSFDAAIKREGETADGRPKVELYGSFYVVDGSEYIEDSGFFGGGGTVAATEMLARKYNSGILSAGSVSFRTTHNHCNICNKEFSVNPETKGPCHVIGQKYDGVVCFSVLGNDDKDPGELLEYSLVHQGAVENAGIVQEYNYSSRDGGKTKTLFFDIDPCESLTHQKGEQGMEDQQDTQLAAPALTDETIYLAQPDDETKLAPEVQREDSAHVLTTVSLKDYAQVTVQLDMANSVIEEQKTIIAQLTRENFALSRSVEAMEQLDQAVTQKEEYRQEILTAVKEFHVIAFGQCPEETLSKYEDLSITELTKQLDGLRSEFKQSFQQVRPVVDHPFENMGYNIKQENATAAALSVAAAKARR